MKENSTLSSLESTKFYEFGGFLFLQINSPFYLTSPLLILFALRLNDLKLIPEVVQNLDYRIYSGVDPLPQGPDELRAIHV